MSVLREGFSGRGACGIDPAFLDESEGVEEFLVFVGAGFCGEHGVLDGGFHVMEDFFVGGGADDDGLGPAGSDVVEVDGFWGEK